MSAAIGRIAPRRLRVHRTPLILRITHWLNALAIVIMIGSGWRIYNWYPALPLDWQFPVWLSLGGDPHVTQGLSGEDGLANALAWHFGAMWLLALSFAVYLGYGVLSGHFRRDLLPVGPASFLRDFLAAARGRLAHRLGEQNAVQKTFYWGVMLAIVVMLLSGLSIWKPVQFGFLTALFGGYEIARVIHFLGMAAIVGFLVVHVALALLVPKTLQSMVTGIATEPVDEGVSP